MNCQYCGKPFGNHSDECLVKFRDTTNSVVQKQHERLDNAYEAQLSSVVLEKFANRVLYLESRSSELDTIRSTLILNFGDTPYNKYGTKINCLGTTEQILGQVLEQLIKGKP